MFRSRILLLGVLLALIAIGGLGLMTTAAAEMTTVSIENVEAEIALLQESQFETSLGLGCDRACFPGFQACVGKAAGTPCGFELGCTCKVCFGFFSCFG